MNTKERIAKVIRVLSVPPIMVSVFILILPSHKKYIFTHVSQIIIMILLLGIISALAYVLSDMIPAIKIKGREGQRKLVFITTLIGYTVSLLWAVITGVNNEYSANGRPLVTVEKSTQYAKQVHLTKKLNTVGSPF